MNGGCGWACLGFGSVRFGLRLKRVVVTGERRADRCQRAGRGGVLQKYSPTIRSFLGTIKRVLHNLVVPRESILPRKAAREGTAAAVAAAVAKAPTQQQRNLGKHNHHHCSRQEWHLVSLPRANMALT